MGKIREEAPKREEPIAIKAELKEELVDAIIDGAVCINIRRDPEVKPNNQIAILAKGTKIIVVDPKKTVSNKDGEWFKVRLRKDAKPNDEDNNGFAMKKFIKVI